MAELPTYMPFVTLALACSLAIMGNWWLWRRLISVQSLLVKERAQWQKELTVVNQTQIGLGKRLVAYEREFKTLVIAQKPQPAVQPQKPEPMPAEADKGAYNSAVDLFKRGYSADEVSRRCGLSKAEASLMALVNRELSPQH